MVDRDHHLRPPSYINAALQLVSGAKRCALCEALAAAIARSASAWARAATRTAITTTCAWLTDVAGVTETAATRIAWHLDSVTRTSR